MAQAAGPQPPRPPNMEAIVELNRGPFLGAQPPLTQLDIALDDAVVLDVRDAHAFAAGHRPGAVNVPGVGLGVRHEVGVRAAGAADRHRRGRRGRGARSRRSASRAVGIFDLARAGASGGGAERSSR